VTRFLIVALSLAAAAFPQMTPEQRLFDFQTLANIFAKNYAPYEWKRDTFGVDLYNTRPWADRIRRAQSDLEAIEIMSEYVASLRDAHSQFEFDSIYTARLGFSVDLFDGKPLVDSIDRSLLPASTFPIEIGDELIAIDGRTAEQWIEQNARFLGMAEERSLGRLAARYITLRYQAYFPRAFEHDETAAVQILHQNGETVNYQIPWQVTGVPFRQVGPVPSPKSAAPLRTSAAQDNADLGVNPGLRQLWAYHNRRAGEHIRVNGLGARNPVYRLPDGFVTRLGRAATDFHFSGTYLAGGKRIGLIRIPNFAPTNMNAAINEIVNEVFFMEANTDALVVDVTRNTGGGCYGTVPLQLLIPYRFRLPADELRATASILTALDQELTLARQPGSGYEPWEIALLESMVDQVRTALNENRGRTGPIPICSASFDWEPAGDGQGNVLAYSKPIVLLTDEFTISWGDLFATVMQDSNRATLFGYRTQGAGGAVSGLRAGSFSETSTSFSISLGIRQTPTFSSEYGTSNVMENVGVRPHSYYDAMTRENLLEQGRPFTDAFTRVVLEELQVR
jgi:hypothetical protein